MRRTLADLLSRTRLTAPDHHDVVARLLGDEDERVVEAATFAAGELDRPPAGLVGRLADLATGHRDPLVREGAVAALGSLGAEAGRDAIVAACGDRATVRRRAVLALAHFDGPEIDTLLDRLAGDRDLQVRQAAEDLVAIRRGEAAGAAPPAGGEVNGQPAKSLDWPL